MTYVSTYAWFRWDTKVTNRLSETIELSAIARDGHDNQFILEKNGWFPVEPTHSYEAIVLKPGQTAVMTWDWDDQTLNGFRVRLRGGAAFYHRIDSRKASDCCYPSELEYSIDSNSLSQSSPAEIEALGKFQRSDRWKSYLAPNIFAFLFWSALLYPALLMFRRTFLRARRLDYASSRMV